MTSQRPKYLRILGGTVALFHVNNSQVAGRDLIHMAIGEEKFKTWFLVALFFLFNSIVRFLNLGGGFILVLREI